MRLCRFIDQEVESLGFYLNENQILPLRDVAHSAGFYELPVSGMLDLLPGGAHVELAQKLQAAVNQTVIEEHALATSQVKLLTPIAAPGKMIFLAGNYADHVAETGGTPEDPQKTFPYLFMKPLSTLTHPGDAVRIPASSPSQIDWEIELGVIIGRPCSQVSAAEALSYVAGYTVVNDISDRGFRPNPDRTPRPKDPFFDWLHGKWHDTFCPLGPCILPADECDDPQNLALKLTVNGQVEQNSSTSHMTFGVAEILAFVSSLVSLAPGDLISTGTPAGVGKAKNRFLQAGDSLFAEIAGIGTLTNPVA